MIEHYLAIKFLPDSKKRAALCELEYYVEHKRLVLSNIKDQFKICDLVDFLQKKTFKRVVVDNPLELSPCISCELDCPGEAKCPEESVVKARNFLADYLSSSAVKLKKRPKRGLSPYQNRPLEVYIWAKYYDDLLKFFNYSYNSTVEVSTSAFSKLTYIKNVIGDQQSFYESNYFIILLELYYQRILEKRDLDRLSHKLEEMVAREKIVYKIESEFNLFMYDMDRLFLTKNTMAFRCFLLALVANFGESFYEKFLIPKFKKKSI